MIKSDSRSSLPVYRDEVKENQMKIKTWNQLELHKTRPTSADKSQGCLIQQWKKWRLHYAVLWGKYYIGEIQLFIEPKADIIGGWDTTACHVTPDPSS